MKRYKDHLLLILIFLIRNVLKQAGDSGKRPTTISYIHVENIDVNMDDKRIDGIGVGQFYRGRPIQIQKTVYCPTVGEVRRRIQVINEESQHPPQKIRLFRWGDELLDDNKKLTRFCIDVVYGDEQPMHIRGVHKTYQTVGVQSSDHVRTLIEKYCRSLFQINSLLLNGTVLDPNRTISSYNIRDGTVLEEHVHVVGGVISPCAVCLAGTEEKTTEIVKTTTEKKEEASETVEETTETVEKTTEMLEEATKTVEKTTEMVEEATETVKDTTREVPSAFMIMHMDAIGNFGDVWGSLKCVVEKTTELVGEATESIKETTEKEENPTDIDEEATETIEEEQTTEMLEETTETVEKPTETVEKTTEMVEKTTEIEEEATKRIEEEKTTEMLEETTATVEKTNDTVKKTTETVEKNPEIEEEATEIEEEATETLEEEKTTEMLEETTATVEKTYDTVEKTTETVEKTPEIEEEATEIEEEATETLEEKKTTEMLEETTETVEETTEPVRKTSEMVDEANKTVEDTTGENPTGFMMRMKEAIGKFGDVWASLKSVVSAETCRTLAHILGAPKLDDMLTFITRLVKEVKFELPEVLQRASIKVLSDQDFIGIANSVGDSWQSLGYSLGLNQVQIEHICSDNQTTAMRIFNMLKLWAKSNTGDPKAGTLLQTMWSCAGLSVHWGTIFKMFA